MGISFLEDMLKGDVLDEMMRVCPVKPNEDGVETVQYVYANYFLARRMATDEKNRYIVSGWQGIRQGK